MSVRPADSHSLADVTEIALGFGGDVAARYDAGRSPVLPDEMVGVARDVATGILPINGLRHRPAGRSCGWCIGAGNDFSSAAYYFEPRHVEHLGPVGRWVRPYLELPPGWRFLIAPDYEDVWFDARLLRPS